MSSYIPSKPTLCCTCKTPSPTCPWKYNFTPVEGWEAEPTKIRVVGDDKFDNSYIVKSCPLYEENTREKREVASNKYTRSKFNGKYHPSRKQHSL